MCCVNICRKQLEEGICMAMAAKEEIRNSLRFIMAA